MNYFCEQWFNLNDITCVVRAPWKHVLAKHQLHLSFVADELLVERVPDRREPTYRLIDTRAEKQSYEEDILLVVDVSLKYLLAAHGIEPVCVFEELEFYDIGTFMVDEGSVFVYPNNLRFAAG